MAQRRDRLRAKGKEGRKMTRPDEEEEEDAMTCQLLGGFVEVASWRRVAKCAARSAPPTPTLSTKSRASLGRRRSKMADIDGSDRRRRSATLGFKKAPTSTEERTITTTSGTTDLRISSGSSCWPELAQLAKACGGCRRPWLRASAAASSERPAVGGGGTSLETAGSQPPTANRRPKGSSRVAPIGGASRQLQLALAARNWLAAPTLLLIIMLLLGSLIRVGEAVDCFKCSSRNGSNPACEDPFHNLNTTRITSPVLPDPQPSVIYHTPCYAGKKGKEGLFPASACIKLTGTLDATGETLVVRHCALDSGTLTQDTELARMSHCGKFQFESDLLRGCVLACPEDACNSAMSSWPAAASSLLLLLLNGSCWIFLGLLLTSSSTLCCRAPLSG